VRAIDPWFQSYKVEMAEVIGGNFWKPYGANGMAAKAAPTSDRRRRSRDASVVH
jgi:hypothetical protein